MYRSLKTTGEDFTLYVVCFDELTYQVLVKLALPGLKAIPLEAFESPQLLAVKGQRTAGEYCWTCTSHVIQFVLNNYRLSEVTYLDADLFFYEKPSVLLEKFAQSDASVMITPHRYTPRYDKSSTCGIYCVQFMTFKANACGLAALQWWQDRCIEWCYARFEDGKFGDQKYLDDWPERFPGIYVLEYIGGGVAPWNIQQYLLAQRNGKLLVNGLPLVFYHFHAYTHYTDQTHNLGPYRLDRDVVNLIYRPYVEALADALQEIVSAFPTFNRGQKQKDPVKSWKLWLWRMACHLRGELNDYKSL